MRTLRFGTFDVNLNARELRRDGTLIPIQDLPFRLLVTLLEQPGVVVSRAELTQALWGTETFVNAVAGLNTAVAKLRDALGDAADDPVYIETVPRRGYRFIGAVDAQLPGEPPRLPSPVQSPAEAPSSAAVQNRRRRRLWPWAAAVLVLTAAGAWLGLGANPAKVRVAVVLFDNETDRVELDRLAQRLTDATVFALAADDRLDVVGNAAVLRTARPFRDLGLVRDTVSADFIVIGQVQTLDQGVLVRTHLIRARDEAHVWVGTGRLAAGGEEVLQSTTSSRVASAVAAHAFTGSRRRFQF